MDIDLKEYYEARFDMLGSKGWKDLIQDIEGMIKTTNTLSGVNDEKTLHFRRGELSIMNWLINLSNMSEEAYKELHASNE